MYCQKCGREIVAGSIFCSYCGAKQITGGRKETIEVVETTRSGSILQSILTSISGTILITCSSEDILNSVRQLMRRNFAKVKCNRLRHMKLTDEYIFGIYDEVEDKIRELHSLLVQDGWELKGITSSEHNPDIRSRRVYEKGFM
jgi:hypothetical protein